MIMSGMEGILHGRCKPGTSETDQERGKIWVTGLSSFVSSSWMTLHRAKS